MASIQTHVNSNMTIRYTNKKGLSFIIDVRLRGPNFVLVKIQFFSNRAPALIRRRFSIPYGHDGIIVPFDFNGLEEGIQTTLEVMYKDATYEEFKREEMVEMIDIIMLQEARVRNINLDVNYDDSGNSSA
ncbi:beta C1 protein [Mungbean yellow mosaic India virus associated betasatellite [India: Faizabad: Cow Pea:2012]]|uniref:Beta C1 protein n=1 Tax=Mungbean yellow mosaic India virus associated betasatellite [India: Faizabad: Cow Pea:2012] TaxID=1238162 RepID=K4JBA9_9VIRU|nr:beta C1 protein [Mungbean yellow mosaic India virus associated betasatellite [India: Faizabad: Cow Pea:2012]]AFU81117.1 beta C1 protein [Mungbean yellow mosaic India virus associated betasatellite [India: Faizabad: Cow Pea:2012]]